MLEFSEPKWKAFSLGCYLAPLELGSLILWYWTNGIHHAYRHRMHWLSSLRNYFYACDVSSENKTWCFFSRQKSRRWPLGGGGGGIAANLRFCASMHSVHFLAPKIHVFSTCSNDVLCPAPPPPGPANILGFFGGKKNIKFSLPIVPPTKHRTR